MKKVVIVGGGFCGALVARELDRRGGFDVTLVDKKNYFEYTPSIHKVIFEGKYLKKITVPYRQFLKNTRVVADEVTSVTPKKVSTKGKRRFSFDYLVVAAGIDYPIFLENKKNVCTLKSGVGAAQMGAAILNADRIVIIGGGLIGVEIAGELATKAQGKKITVVHPHDRLLERNPLKAGAYARKFLEKRGVELVFGERVVKHRGRQFVTSKGRKVEADAGIWCAGIKFNPWFMKFPKSVFTERNALKVNKHLQLHGYRNIFVGGDITSVREEKTAQNAERHAHLILKNIDRLEKRQKLDIHIPRSAPLVISLGDWFGIMTFPGRWVLTGLFPGILKWLIEWWVLRGYK